MKVLITFALANEFAAWRELREFSPAKWGGRNACVATIGDAETTVVLTGVGARCASDAASQMLRQNPDAIDCCVISGLAGGLRPEYRLSEILAGKTISSNGMIPCDDGLVAVAGALGARLVDRFHTSDQAVCTATEKRSLGAVADAVDMESFAIAQEAQTLGVKTVVIRAISDTVDEDLPLDANHIFGSEGQVSVPRVLGQLARRPQALPGVVRLARNSRDAAAALAHFLDRYVAALAQRPEVVSLEVRSDGKARGDSGLQNGVAPLG